MTPQEALAVARSLRAKGTPLRLEAALFNGRVVFSGGKYGDHCLSIEASSPERVKAHWDGYVQQNGGTVARVCPTRCISNEDLTSDRYRSDVLRVIVAKDGSYNWLIRRVTRSTGHHVFFRVTETGKASRIASDTSGGYVHRNAPKFVREALADCVTESGAISLHTLRMSERRVAAEKRSVRAAKQPYGRARYYGVGIYR